MTRIDRFKEKRIEVLLFELFLEYDKTNNLLMEALGYLEEIGHPFVDKANDQTLTKWLWRHIESASTYCIIAERLSELGFVLPKETQELLAEGKRIREAKHEEANYDRRTHNGNCRD